MAIWRTWARMPLLALAVSGTAAASSGACSVDSVATASDAGSDASDAAATDTGVDACVAASTATSGAADTHCTGRATQVTSGGSCAVDAGTSDAGDDSADAGDDASTDDASTDAGADAAVGCGYGATMFGQEGDDDDCKYHLVWTTTGDICNSTTGTSFSVTVTNKSDGSPAANLTGGLLVETFVSLADGGCDDQSKHAGSDTGTTLTETPAGSGIYVGTVAFDTAGLWTMRFHIREDCTTALADSPHGTAAFHLTVP